MKIGAILDAIDNLSAIGSRSDFLCVALAQDNIALEGRCLGGLYDILSDLESRIDAIASNLDL